MVEQNGLQVLLVEDDPGERWIMSEILRSRGHVVSACETAEAGWERFTDEPHPLVLLDWLLPGMDGLELCRRIRKHRRGDETVVVVVTSRDKSEDLQEVLRAGADDYVTKPIDVGLLNIRLAVAENEVVDVQLRKRTQEKLEARSRELRRLFGNPDEVFITLDLVLEELLQVSPAARTVLGRTPEELKMNPDLWRELLYPREPQAQQEARGSDETCSLSRQYRIEDPDGRVRWLEASVKVTRGPDGGLERTDGIVSDVTEEHRAQRELAIRDEELRTLYRISETVLSATSLDEAYADIVDEVRRATDYPVVAVEHFDEETERMVIRAATGLDLDDEEAAPEIPIHQTLSGVAVRTGSPVVEPDARTRKEHSHDLLLRSGVRSYVTLPMFLRGRVVGTLTLAHTRPMEPDRRLVRWAGNLANSITTLMDRVAAREALVESEREHRILARRLKQANEELEAFAYSVSHDLRTPVRTMQGFAHTLLDDHGAELPAEARSYLERILASGERAEDLIRDLLAYSRLSLQELQLQPVALDDVVEAALEQLAADIEERGAVVQVDDGLPRGRSHPATLVQVLSNLLNNALKFVPPERTPEVGVSAEERDDAVRVWVEDNGPGVPPDQTERIFRLFERLGDGDAQPGTGIGLAIVRRGMERLGGRAGVAPADGRGSRFWFEIPRERSGQAPAARGA